MTAAQFACKIMAIYKSKSTHCNKQMLPKHVMHVIDTETSPDGT